MHICASNLSDMKKVQEEVNEALNNYIEATNTHNFDEVRKCIDDNAIYWFSNKSCTTTETISAFFVNAWNTIKEEIYAANHVNWIALSEEAATCIYEYSWKGYLNNELKSGGGRATNVFVKKNGKWLLVHEHLSPFPPKE